MVVGLQTTVRAQDERLTLHALCLCTGLVSQGAYGLCNAFQKFPAIANYTNLRTCVTRELLSIQQQIIAAFFKSVNKLFCAYWTLFTNYKQHTRSRNEMLNNEEVIS